MDLPEKILQIIAEEAGMSRDELGDDSEFWDVGVDDTLAKCIISRIHGTLRIDLPLSVFVDNPSVADLKIYLDKYHAMASPNLVQTVRPSTTAVKSEPLSLVLQGKPDACRRILFLLPDGSGSAMAYARLPRVDADTCLIALNSPYLRASPSAAFSVEGIAETWASEIRRRQSHGPYLLGGWSAGGYYAFEVCKALMSQYERVDSIVLIDSPCRLVYEALPMEVVRYLSRSNMMGNWGNKPAPDWLIDHFSISIRAIEDYMPTALHGPDMPQVFMIWAEKGMLNGPASLAPELDMNVKVTRMLIERPYISGAMGWERLFPGAKLSVAKMPGNHFTIVYPPYVSSISNSHQDVSS